MSIIISLREVIPAELEREEDCWNEMPTTRRDVPRIILVEADCLGNAAVCFTVYAAKTTTFHYSTVGVGRGTSTLDNAGPWNDVPAARSCRDNGSYENPDWLNYGGLQGACGYSIVKQGLLPDCLVDAKKGITLRLHAVFQYCS